MEIEFIDAGEDFLTARMPVNERVFQPDGVLHGGATFALAETVGSFAAHLINHDREVTIRGIEMSGNHLKRGLFMPLLEQFITEELPNCFKWR